MVKEEIWSVSIDRARAFFSSQQGVLEQETDLFSYKSCSARISELKPKGMGVWAAKRIKLHMEGEDADVAELYHRFFIQFLSTGG